MIKNYIKVSIRNLISQRGYTLINIFGLAIGIASALLIMLYVIDEMSYDKFHPNAKNIYRICIDAKLQDTEMRAPISNAPIGPTAVETYPDILNYTRIFTFGGDPDIRYEDKVFVEKNIIHADSTFFQVFNGFKLIRGNPDKILNVANQVILTESSARRYFGDDDPIGKVLKVWQNSQNWEVVGIMEDIPTNSHLKFDMIHSMVSLPMAQSNMWIGNNNYTYIYIQEGLDPEIINQRLLDLVVTHAGPQFEEFMGSSFEELGNSGNRYTYFTQPLLDIHLKSNMPFEMEKGGNLTMVYVFMIIAVFILIIAAINFMNLSTARSAKRAKEVGIRKVVGSTKASLISQFLTESVMVSTISLAIALGIVALAIPHFNNIANKEILLSSLPVGLTIGILLVTILVIGFAAGSYPAFFLASFEPIKVLKGKLKSGMKSGLLRGVLVVVQFTITIGLIVSTFVVFKQISYIQSKDLGYNPSEVMVINRPYVIPEQSRQSFVDELKKLPNVEAVARASSLPTTIIGNTVMQKQGAANDDFQTYNFFYAHHDLDKTLQFKMAEGRYFNENFASDSSAMVINQAAVKGFGFDGSPIGQIVVVNGNDTRTVVGVMEDFHYESLHQKISPLAICSQPVYTYLTIRIQGGNVQETIRSVETKWNEFVSDQDMDYFFLEEAVENQYSDEKRARTLFASFSFLAIIIGALGLLGLSSYTAEQRTREIGIRKVMGARISMVVWLLLKEINKLVLISTVIAWPAAWYLMSQWLEGFAFRISLTPWIFIAASILSYLVAVITVSYQAFKAAKTNPAITLKYE
jgi:putative ABC transport system permease protein